MEATGDGRGRAVALTRVKTALIDQAEIRLNAWNTYRILGRNT
jgi:hypothetical protein